MVNPRSSAPAFDDDLDVKILRVEEDTATALVLEDCGSGKEGRTRWTFLKHVPQKLLVIFHRENERESKESCDDFVDRTEKKREILENNANVARNETNAKDRRQMDERKTERVGNAGSDTSSSRTEGLLSKHWKTVTQSDDPLPISHDQYTRIFEEIESAHRAASSYYSEDIAGEGTPNDDAVSRATHEAQERWTAVEGAFPQDEDYDSSIEDTLGRTQRDADRLLRGQCGGDEPVADSQPAMMAMLRFLDKRLLDESAKFEGSLNRLLDDDTFAGYDNLQEIKRATDLEEFSSLDEYETVLNETQGPAIDHQDYRDHYEQKLDASRVKGPRQNQNGNHCGARNESVHEVTTDSVEKPGGLDAESFKPRSKNHPSEEHLLDAVRLKDTTGTVRASEGQPGSLHQRNDRECGVKRRRSPDNSFGGTRRCGIAPVGQPDAQAGDTIGRNIGGSYGSIESVRNDGRGRYDDDITDRSEGADASGKSVSNGADGVATGRYYGKGRSYQPDEETDDDVRRKSGQSDDAVETVSGRYRGDYGIDQAAARSGRGADAWSSTSKSSSYESSLPSSTSTASDCLRSRARPTPPARIPADTPRSSPSSVSDTDTLIAIDAGLVSEVDGKHAANLDEQRETDSPVSSKSSPLSSSESDRTSPTPSFSPTSNISGIEFKASHANVSSTGGADAGAGWGVFCSDGVQRGGVVFEEEALLSVCPQDVDEVVWNVITAVTRETATADVLNRMTTDAPEDDSAAIHPVDLLQAVAWDRVDRDVQIRVLKLFAPEPSSFPDSRLAAWTIALDVMEDRGALSTPSGNCTSAGSEKASDAHRQEAKYTCSTGEKRHGPGNAQSDGETCGRDAEGLDEKRWSEVSERGAGMEGRGVAIGMEEQRRVDLVRVLMICEANIFGEDDEQATEYGSRFLFETACRINHSCLPNCTYTIRDGRVTVRALVDLTPGTELSIAYLTSDGMLRSTDIRRELLRVDKHFICNCDRCTSKYDSARAFRCPNCHKGSVYPATAGYQPPPTNSTPSPRGGLIGAFDESAPNSEDAPVGDEEDVGTCDHSDVISACNECRMTPTTSWLVSAVRVEKLLSEAVDCTETWHEDRVAQTIPHLHAIGLYLLGEHHLMADLHCSMAAFLQHSGRFDEAAYHLHEILRMWHTIFNRPLRRLAEVYHQLGNDLLVVARVLSAERRKRPLDWMLPAAGRCGTYTGLVQSSPPTHAKMRPIQRVAETSRSTDSTPVAADSTETAGDFKGSLGAGGVCDATETSSPQDENVAIDDREDGSSCGPAEWVSTENGVCVVCDRVHGRSCDVPLQHEPSKKSDLRAQLRGSLQAFSTAADVYCTLFGESDPDTIAARRNLVGMQNAVTRRDLEVRGTYP